MEGRGLGGKEMPSQSSANLLDLIAADSNFPLSPSHPARLPRVMVDPCILSTAGVTDDDSSLAMPECRIIVSYHLPLWANPDPAAPSDWSFSYDLDALVVQLCSSLPTSAEVLHVNTLCGLPDGLNPTHHDVVAAHLHCEFCYVPILIPLDLHARF